MTDDLGKGFFRIEPVPGIILSGRRRRLSGQSLAHEAEIARSSRGFELSAGTGHRQQRCGHRRG
ncbi:hypothetical protein [Novosphingobium sp. RL4]|uniref:hypothetical protein n=1 Tax=Novosphingobium sp. RL4 TaxID=3109595 RepID=UPI002D78E408|nr:hypothetical protein [Novosphingobium sp. RL4]WRT91936.1 hypothetical protein U9J33_12015 [Novosphingobium sp. RL4]